MDNSGQGMILVSRCSNRMTMATVLFVLIVCFVCVVQTDAADMSKDEAMSMLKKYHYMGENSPDPSMRSDSMFDVALAMYQDFMGLNVTGNLDNETMEMMKKPRCGLPDMTGMGYMMKRKKRYATADTMWRDGIVTYRLNNYPSTDPLEMEQVSETIEEAFKMWQSAAQLNISKVDGRADIEISFLKGDHGDGFPFEGQYGNDIAHAFYPGSRERSGDIHFNDDMTFNLDDFNFPPTHNFLWIALHEIGHSLGLNHSDVPSSIMAPTPPFVVPEPIELHDDDIRGISYIYGRSGMTDRAKFCAQGTFDAVVSLGEDILVFQGDAYARLAACGLKPGYPRMIQADWEGLPTHLDAGFSFISRQHGLTILLFKGDQYWRYTLEDDDTFKKNVHYPRNIATDFRNGLPSRFDAIFTWSGNKRNYIVRGTEYYRLKRSITITESRIIAQGDDDRYGYPREFERYWDMETPIDDAVCYGSRTYFFNGTQYYRYNDDELKEEDGYPKTITDHWYHCLQDKTQSTMEMELPHDSPSNIVVSKHYNATATADTKTASHVVMVFLVSMVIGVML